MRFITDEAPTRAPRRNDIAFDRRETHHVAYGRISTIRNGIATILNARDGTLEIPIEHVGIDPDYKGLEIWGDTFVEDGIEYREFRLRRMPSLRRIKQFVSRREGRAVWAKDRRRMDRSDRRRA